MQKQLISAPVCKTNFYPQLSDLVTAIVLIGNRWLLHKNVTKVFE